MELEQSQSHHCTALQVGALQHESESEGQNEQQQNGILSLQHIKTDRKECKTQKTLQYECSWLSAFPVRRRQDEGKRQDESDFEYRPNQKRNRIGQVGEGKKQQC